jgi:hypothetical protein
MMKKPVCFSLVILFLSAHAFTWSPNAQKEIAIRAISLMPPSFQEILKTNLNSLGDGAIIPFEWKDLENHYQHADGTYGKAAAKAEEEVKTLIELIKTGGDLSLISFQFGVVSHYVSDVDHPLHTSDADPQEHLYYAEFNKYIDQNMSKIPVIFYGYTLPIQDEKAGVQEFLLQSAERSNRFYHLIGTAFLNKKGKLVPASRFDERSVPFGIASISLSHAVTDVANVWLRIWAQSGKSIASTPYLNPPAQKESPGKTGRPEASKEKKGP